MTKFINFFMLAVAAVIAVSSTGCNLPGGGGGDDDDDEPEPTYTYINGQAVYVSDRNWNVTLDYQCSDDPLEVGVIVMKDVTELRRVLADRKGSAYQPEGQLELEFSWRDNERGCQVVPFVSTSTDGVVTGYEIAIPYGAAVNSITVENAENYELRFSMNYFCDCNIQESKLLIYNSSDNLVSETYPYVNGFSSDEDFETTLSGYQLNLMPTTDYRAVMTITTEYNSASAECRFTTPKRRPNQGDNNPPQQ